MLPLAVLLLVATHQAIAAPSATSLQTDLTFLFQNDLNCKSRFNSVLCFDLNPTSCIQGQPPLITRVLSSSASLEPGHKVLPHVQN